MGNQPNGIIGLYWGEPCSCLDGDAESFFEGHPELREIADTLALEACVNDDVPGFVAIYPYRHWSRQDGEAVRVHIL